jgi:protein-tyrosine phosphatase
MDAENYADIVAQGPASAPDVVRMFRDFDPLAGADRDVPDPYFGGADGFEQVLAMVERTSAALVDELEPVLRARAAEAH